MCEKYLANQFKSVFCFSFFNILKNVPICELSNAFNQKLYDTSYIKSSVYCIYIYRYTSLKRSNVFLH